MPGLTLRDVYVSSGPNAGGFVALGDATIDNIGHSTGPEPPMSSFEASEKLKAKIRVMHMEAFAEHCRRIGQAPAYSLAQSATGKLLLALPDCTIAAAEVAPEFILELTSKYDVELPILVDFAVGDGAFYVHVHEPVTPAPQTQNQTKPG